MTGQTRDGATFYQFENFKRFPFVNAVFSTRNGGVSEGCFASMNLGYGRGDADENVTANFGRFCRAAGFDPEHLVFSRQIHETEIRRVTLEDARSADRQKSWPSGVDGLVTDEPGCSLVTFYADCAPLFFVDPVQKAIGLSHAGWRGTLAEIGPLTVQKLVTDYGSRPADIWAGIGPSAGPCCFEVGGEVRDAFQKLPYAAPFFAPNRPGHFLLDLWGLNTAALVTAGVPPEQIETAGLCTICNPELFYSHRRDGAARGSMAAFLAINL